MYVVQIACVPATLKELYAHFASIAGTPRWIAFSIRMDVFISMTTKGVAATITNAAMPLNSISSSLSIYLFLSGVFSLSVFLLETVLML